MMCQPGHVVEAARKGEIIHVEVWALQWLNGFYFEIVHIALLREVTIVTSLRFGVLTSCRPIRIQTGVSGISKLFIFHSSCSLVPLSCSVKF